MDIWPIELQQELLPEIGQLDISVGTLQATNSRMAQAVAEPIEDLWQWARQQSHVHVDETPAVCAGSQGMAVDCCRRGIWPVSCSR